jgi:uncharacterized protein
VVTLVGLGLIALAAFLTEGAIGFGGTVIAASIGAQLVSLDELLPAFVPVNMALSAWLVAAGWRAVAWRVLLVEIAPMVACGAAIGLALFHVPAKSALALGFGVFVAGLAIMRLARSGGGPLPRVIRLGLLGLGGVAHGLFGTGGPMIVYVLGRRDAEREAIDKHAFRATLAVLWLTLNTALLANFLSLGLYRDDTFAVGGVIAATVIPGLLLGERLHRALNPQAFERVVWIVLFAAGAALAVRSALG